MQKTKVPQGAIGVLGGMLRKVDFFAPLPVDVLSSVLPHIRMYSYEAGERVFTQGQAGDAFYIIYEGKADVTLKRWVFLSTTIARLKPGDFFGEIALISSAPRTATVVCTEPTRLFVLVSDDFKLVLKENPSAAEEMQRIAARRAFDTSHAA